MKKSKIKLLNLESLETNDLGLLVGGFSATLNSRSKSAGVLNTNCQTANNCTKFGCGTKE